MLGGAYERLLPISALQHFVFCERQCALIHLEREWIDNALTVEGTALHDKAHGGRGETAGGVRVARGVELASVELGVRGIADVVEFHPDGRLEPVEYKRGRPKRGDEDRVQVCAQATCLEEMFGTAVPRGSIFYGKARRRTVVEFDSELRRRTAAAAAGLHALIASETTPTAELEPKCRRCSMRDICLPEALPRSVRRGYLAARARELDDEPT